MTRIFSENRFTLFGMRSNHIPLWYRPIKPYRPARTPTIRPVAAVISRN
ncbi:hypothetical protein GJU90_04280 [Brucella sp. 10RB9210]|nr:hypothetical protein [Brucella sp. 10RB9210]